ncbi:MAG: helix-turn-helix domain-containing protein [Bryobacteraceae bacterium]|nr:helix-turn-helix domain-containing protein [Bryobacteraceae bacterium]
MQFGSRLQIEFEARKTKNPRYSLRAFAASIGAEHSTVSQILRGTRPVPTGTIRAWALKLGMLPEEAAIYVAASHAATPESSRRAQQLLHWTAEALAVINEPVHFDILRMTRDPGFRPDVRWISRQTGVSIDHVNIALTRLLRLQLLEMASGEWKDVTGFQELTERKVRKLALERVRWAAAENRINLGRKSNS